jgi:prophage regulatory protein
MAAILRLPQALAESGKGRSAWYADISRGLMTRGVKLSRRAVGWPADEIQTINRARIAGQSESAIRVLVARLHALRLEAAK